MRWAFCRVLTRYILASSQAVITRQLPITFQSKRLLARIDLDISAIPTIRGINLCTLYSYFLSLHGLQENKTRGFWFRLFRSPCGRARLGLILLRKYPAVAMNTRISFSVECFRVSGGRTPDYSGFSDMKKRRDPHCSCDSQ